MRGPSGATRAALQAVAESAAHEARAKERKTLGMRARASKKVAQAQEPTPDVDASSPLPTLTEGQPLLKAAEKNKAKNKDEGSPGGPVKALDTALAGMVSTVQVRYQACMRSRMRSPSHASCHAVFQRVQQVRYQACMPSRMPSPSHAFSPRLVNTIASNLPHGVDGRRASLETYN